jgi:dynein light chain LC8-type
MSDEEDEEKVVDPTAALLANLPPVRVRRCDMPDVLFLKIRKMCSDAMAKFEMEKDMAGAIKEQLDMEEDFNQLPGKGPWHVVIGKHFGGVITHETDYVIFFDVVPKAGEDYTRVQPRSVLLFKSMGVTGGST